jgi:hypothetical protein
MPVNHPGNTANANALSKIAVVGAVRGRSAPTFPIYTIDLGSLRNDGVCGPELDNIIRAIVSNDDLDFANRQPTNHEDRLGNLPLAPGTMVVATGKAVEYREYFVKKNKFKWPGFPRLVGDQANKRLFLTPTHYDVWHPDPKVAEKEPQTDWMAQTKVGARSPFFLLRNVTPINALFD